jgi:hypothetical protein
MPVVFRHNGYRFFFYSNEGDSLNLSTSMSPRTMPTPSSDFILK